MPEGDVSRRSFVVKYAPEYDTVCVSHLFSSEVPGNWTVVCAHLCSVRTARDHGWEGVHVSRGLQGLASCIAF
jgi:hypothetical protein